ncbi:arylsulfatase [Acinetobacter oleivorans]|uniref:arylsulfatase n=1 Tax=Acinetobacter oleivorans TaxID=1148157 RepID=UPI001580A222|nr:arylsulfatase [Acinetobacter oleivorans]NUG02542.1 arylsulfatase [Acinetobacter oleivorans]
MRSKLSTLSLSILPLSFLLTNTHAAETTLNATPPNVMIILADDLGYSDISAYGSEIKTPNIDSLLKQGKRFNNFHAQALCSPTRAELLTGKDNHLVGLGAMQEAAEAQRQKVKDTYPHLIDQPGYSGNLSLNAQTLAEVLKKNNYYTFMVGKWHLGLTSPYNPKNRGFDNSYALLDGWGLHYAQGPKTFKNPTVYTENGIKVEVPENFYSTDNFTKKTIEYLGQNKDKKPFFAYVAYTAPHWPVQAPVSYIQMFKGKYDKGYDYIREQRFARQKSLGLIPNNAKLPVQIANNEIGTKSWDQLSPSEKKYEARRMEIYAAMIKNMDDRVGELIKYLKKTGQYDNTLIVFMSDNGAEGSSPAKWGFPVQLFNNSYENMGRSDSFVTIGERWAEVSGTPYTYWKGAAAEGGVRVPMIVKMPKGLSKNQQDINAFASVRDIYPTVLDLTRVSADQTKNIKPSGLSFMKTLKDSKQLVHRLDSFNVMELQGSKYVRNGEWKLVKNASTSFKPMGWKLFNLKNDFNEQKDVAHQYPEIVKQFEKVYEDYAKANQIVDYDQFWQGKKEK